MLLSKKGQELAKNLKIQGNSTEAVKVIQQYIPEKHLSRFDTNQIDALILLINYIGKKRFIDSTVLKAILSITDSRIEEYEKSLENQELKLYHQAGWNFEYEGRMFDKDMARGVQNGFKIGRLFNSKE